MSDSLRGTSRDARKCILIAQTINWRYRTCAVHFSAFIFLLCSWSSVATVQMAEMEYTITEGGSVEVCVELSHLPPDGLQWDIVVTLSTTDGDKACKLHTEHTQVK